MSTVFNNPTNALKNLKDEISMVKKDFPKLKLLLSFGGSNNNHWNYLLGPAYGKSTLPEIAGGASTKPPPAKDANGNIIENAFNCSGYSYSYMQPCVVKPTSGHKCGNDFCCDWGRTPITVNGKTSCEKVKSCKDIGGYECALRIRLLD